MPRRLRIQYHGAIYHVMARGNGRQRIARDDDRRRLQDDLGRAVSRCSWKVYAFVLLSNHLHLVLNTPEPNLARGMRGLLLIGRRGSRHQARAALAYLARRHTAVPNSELAEVLGVSRPDCVPNLTRKFAGWLATRADVRRRLAQLEDQLDRALEPAGEKTANLVFYDPVALV